MPGKGGGVITITITMDTALHFGFLKHNILDNACSSTAGKNSRQQDSSSPLLEMKHCIFYYIPLYKGDKELPWARKVCDHAVTNTTTEHHFTICLNTRNI
jgi:hypothetical protein